MVLNEFLNILPISRSPSIFRLVKHAIYPWSMEKSRFSPCQTTQKPTQPPLCARWAIEPVDQSKSWVGCSTFASMLGWSSHWGLKTFHWLRLEKIWGWNIKKNFPCPKKRAFNPSITEFSASPCLVNMYVYIYIYTVYIYIYMVGGWALPLWKIWLRHLGLWNSQYVESHNPFMFQSTNQNSINLHCCWWNHHFPMVFLWFSYGFPIWRWVESRTLVVPQNSWDSWIIVDPLR